MPVQAKQQQHQLVLLSCNMLHRTRQAAAAGWIFASLTIKLNHHGQQLLQCTRRQQEHMQQQQQQQQLAGQASATVITSHTYCVALSPAVISQVR
jgi:NAD dependent epimerase/dehydratase family enzyme